MKTILKSLFILFCVSAGCSNISKAQSFAVDVSYTSDIADVTKKLIFYKTGQLLSISDFTGTPETSNAAVAITSSGFAFKAGYKNEAGKSTLLISVFCSFDKQQSWMKVTGKNPYILSHEQLHFDISYIAAKAFVSKLKVAKFTSQNYKSLIESTYAEATQNLEKMQQQYDGETNNGQIKEKQELWSQKVAALLSQCL